MRLLVGDVALLLALDVCHVRSFPKTTDSPRMQHDTLQERVLEGKIDTRDEETA